MKHVEYSERARRPSVKISISMFQSFQLDSFKTFVILIKIVKYEIVAPIKQKQSFMALQSKL